MGATLIIVNPLHEGDSDFPKRFAEFLKKEIYPEYGSLVWKVLSTKDFQMMDVFREFSNELNQVNFDKILWGLDENSSLNFVKDIAKIKNQFSKILCLTHYDEDKMKEIFILLELHYSKENFEGITYFKAIYR